MNREDTTDVAVTLKLDNTLSLADNTDIDRLNKELNDLESVLEQHIEQVGNTIQSIKDTLINHRDAIESIIKLMNKQK